LELPATAGADNIVAENAKLAATAIPLNRLKFFI
jgi:hypothetical protein